MKSYINNFWEAAIFAIIASFIYALSLLKLNFYIEEDLKILDFAASRLPKFEKPFRMIRNFIAKSVNRSYK